ncbi:MAG: nucleotidyltransferase domain-containing protein [Candidatus Cloacimonadales bacterium]|nr:nucleotidyltransferase domain-containing protein [Candidatus Cloacimonadales bacterium]
MVDRKILDEVVQRIVINYQPDKLLLYGSQACGKEQTDSDFDLLIIKDNKLPRHKRSREVRPFLRGIKFPIDIIVYTQAEIEKWQNVKNSFIYNVLNSCEILYERKV